MKGAVVVFEHNNTLPDKDKKMFSFFSNKLKTRNNNDINQNNEEYLGIDNIKGKAKQQNTTNSIFS